MLGRLGITIVERQTLPVIVAAEGQEIRVWRAPGMSDLALQWPDVPRHGSEVVDQRGVRAVRQSR